jgi:GTP-binding protein
VRYQGLKINIVDTPGHADFGGEVERTLMMADGALLLVDAAEGPLPQTRFVLRKCLERGFPVIVVINKIDRGRAPRRGADEVFDLFCDLGATDAQTDFPVLYAIGRARPVAQASSRTRAPNLVPLFETILEQVPPPRGRPTRRCRSSSATPTHDDYVGKLAIGRIVRGTVKQGEPVAVSGADGKVTKASVKQLFVFEGLRASRSPRRQLRARSSRSPASRTSPSATPSPTSSDPEALPRIVVEEPTIKMRFGVNTSPFAGK